jgi:hypothetical protein
MDLLSHRRGQYDHQHAEESDRQPHQAIGLRKRHHHSY